MKKILFTQIVLLISFHLYAQQSFYQSQNLPVTKEGASIKNAWAGGVNVPQLSPIDLNNDDILDLVIFEKNGNQINCFINHGTEGVIDYHFAPEYNAKFPLLEDWVLLRDFNCDNKMDIFTSFNAGIKVYKNTSTNNDLSFEPAQMIYTDRGFGPTDLYVSSVDIPHIGDIDYDGDLDILTFSFATGSHVEWHKNTSMDLFDSCDSLNYILEQNCWGNFTENSSDNSVTLNSCEEEKNANKMKSGAHSGSTLTALDLNGDSYFELLLGDITFNNLVMLENSAPAENSIMISQDSQFPSYSQSVNLSRFPASFYFDFDNDNKKDLIIAPNGNNISHNYENIWFYKNESSTNEVILNLSNRAALIDQMIDVGSGAHPVFFDHNNDGLMDLIIANFGYYIDGGNFNSQLALYENIGDINNPHFQWVTNDYCNLGGYNFLNNISPTFGDLDNDGDQDMLIGDENGELHFLVNIPSNNESYFYPSGINYFDIDVGSFASPFLIDLDRDTDLDLIIGTRQGQIYFYENQGSPSEANFVLSSDQLGNINLTDPVYNTAYTTPIVIDGNNGYELYIGSEKGQIHHYINIENDIYGNYEEAIDSMTLYSNGIRTTLAIYDLNNDGWMDMLTGVYTGGLHLLWGCDSAYMNVKENILKNIKIYPNPTEGIIYIDDSEKLLKIDLYNIEGKLCSSYKATNKLNFSNLEQGIYIMKLTTKFNQIIFNKIVIQ